MRTALALLPLIAFLAGCEARESTSAPDDYRSLTIQQPIGGKIVID